MNKKTILILIVIGLIFLIRKYPDQSKAVFFEIKKLAEPAKKEIQTSFIKDSVPEAPVEYSIPETVKPDNYVKHETYQTVCFKGKWTELKNGGEFRYEYYNKKNDDGGYSINKRNPQFYNFERGSKFGVGKGTYKIQEIFKDCVILKLIKITL